MNANFGYYHVLFDAENDPEVENHLTALDFELESAILKRVWTATPREKYSRS